MGFSERRRPPGTSGERETLTGFLQYQRDTLAWKCSGLTAEQLRQRAVPPSNLSLLGLIRHLTAVEHSWFAHTLQGAGASAPHWRETLTAAFDVDTADPDESLRLWHTECARSREITATCESLDTTGTHPTNHTFTLRWILTHMIEEYARHNGHADLLRERLDGHRGE
ncbi:DinB family protein [Nocardia terpenica]|uniref:DinB family protein n=1 Tax=Nocardia terpenica TaxID=455432 RepID=UPI002FDFE415